MSSIASTTMRLAASFLFPESSERLENENDQMLAKATNNVLDLEASMNKSAPLMIPNHQAEDNLNSMAVSDDISDPSSLFSAMSIDTVATTFTEEASVVSGTGSEETADIVVDNSLPIISMKEVTI